METTEREEERAGGVCAAADEAVEGYHLSPQQRRLWPMQQEAGANVYRAQAALEIEGDLERGRLEEALRAVVARHEILRTAFRRQPGYKLPVQVITEDGLPALRAFDLTGRGPEEQAERFAALYREEAERAFDFERAPLLRCLLLKLSERAHVLILTLPALCADARTLDRLSEELGRAYAGTLDASAADETTQYVQFSEWQNELLAEPEAEEGLAYWRGLGLTAAPPLALPYAASKDDGAAFEPAVWSESLGVALAARVEAAARRHRAPLSAFLQACWQTLLWRLTGAPELFVAALDEGRKFEELRDALGLFSKWLPVRCRFHADYCFSEILRQTRQHLAEAEEWQEYFTWGAGDGEGAARFPAFGFEYREEVGAPRQAAGLTFSFRRRDVCVERSDVTLACTREGDALGIAFRYNSTRYEAADIRRLAEEFRTLLADAADDTEKSVSRLRVVGEEERRHLLSEFNDTRADYAFEVRLHELFERQAAQTPEAVAVVYEEQQLTYAELNARANQLARRLRAMGVGPEVLVGVLMERSVEMVVALLGVLKAGGAYVPLDPEYPRDRLSFMLADSAAPVLLTQRRLVESLPAQGAAVLCLDGDEASFEGRPAGNLGTEVSPNGVAYVIYTSGSTGRPKGAALTHANISNHMLWMLREFPLSPSDRVLQKTPLSFDASVWEFWAPLLAGARLVLARPGGHRDAGYLIGAAARHGVTILQVVPALLGALAEAEGLERCGGLRRVFCGGEALTKAAARRVGERLAWAEVVNLYGPTECTIDATWWRCAGGGVGVAGEGGEPIGRPVANVRAYVLDANWQPLPVGVTGELWLGGAGVGRGYLNRPALTAERFVPDPFGGEPGARLYRTGDLARLTPGGYLEYAGRVDHQVKVRGYRIELGEIEAALRRHRAVREAVVLAREERAGDKRLVAYVSTEPGLKPSADELRAVLKEGLPDYMTPQAFVFLDKFPLTPSGKVDRRALPAPEELEAALAESFVAPRTPVEELTAGVWAEVLGVERVGAGDNFFDLGGHSLLGTQVVSRLREAFGVEIGLRHLFESPTVAELAACVEAALRRRQAVEQPPLARAPRDRALPLSFAQQRLWFIDQLEPNSALYNVPLAARLTGRLDVAALERTLNEIVRRHEVLRTTFAAEGGEPVQVIGEPSPVSLPVVELSGLDELQREAEVERLSREEARTPFDLSRGPLLRVRLLRLAEEEHVLLLTMHHVVTDGWSMGVLVREVGALYEAFVEGRRSPLEELPVQYADFAAWQREWLTGETLERQLSYWREQLAGAPAVLELPTDRPRTASRSYEGAREPVVLGPELSEQLKALSRREGVTLFMTLLAAFQALLSRHAGQTDVVVGTDVANRNRRETEELIGFFVNQLVLRTDLSGDPSFRELLGRVRQVTLDAYTHQDVPFEKVVEAVNPERAASVLPLFQAKLGLQNAPGAPLEVAGLTLREPGAGARTGLAKFDLMTILVEGEGGLGGAVDYAGDLFDPQTMARLVRHFVSLLRLAAGRPDARLGELYQYLDELDREQESLERDELRQATLQKFEKARRRAVSRT